MSEYLSTSVSATDWIRIFASCLARRQPTVCAEEVLALAINHFKRCHALAPEVAAQQFVAKPARGARRPDDAVQCGVPFD